MTTVFGNSGTWILLGLRKGFAAYREAGRGKALKLGTYLDYVDPRLQKKHM
jgi:hypothetical protein